MVAPWMRPPEPGTNGSASTSLRSTRPTTAAAPGTGTPFQAPSSTDPDVTGTAGTSGFVVDEEPPAPMDRHQRLEIEKWFGLAVAIACGIFVFVSLGPDLLFKNTTPTGGDMGAHVWGPKFLTDHLLPEFRVTGWTQDWYAGFPAYVFYMVVPSLLIVWLSANPPIWLIPILLVVIGGAAWFALQRVRAPWARTLVWIAVVFSTVLVLPIPYNIAFKLVTVSGLVTLPVALYAVGRAAKVPFPGPPLLAMATLPFIYDRGFTILGGNGASTMAGEFAFSISLTFAFLFLAALFKGIHTGRDRALGAALAAMTVLCHLIPAIFALIATVIILFVRREDRTPWWDANRAGRIVAGALVAVTLITIIPEVTLPDEIVVPLAGLTIPFVGWTLPTPLPQWWFPALASLVALALFTGFQPEFASYFRNPQRRLVAIGVSLVGAGVVLLTIALGLLPFGWWTVALLAIAAGIVLFAGWDWRAVRWVLVVGPVGALLSAFWFLPFLSSSTWMNDMGWEKYTRYSDHLLARDITEMSLTGMPYRNIVFALAGLGVILSLLHRVRLGWFLALTVMVFAWIFRFFPQYRLWNARLLPFLYLAIYLLAGLALALVIRSLVIAVQDLSARTDEPVLVGLIGTGVLVVALAVVLLGGMRLLPGGQSIPDPGDPTSTVYRWGGLNFESSIVKDWARWNYEGLEDKDAFVEFEGIVDMMSEVGEEHGCGRAMWEYEGDLQRFGTPMALMLLPYFTDGCIGSMEGLYFEASSTTPFHFLNQSELSVGPSRAQRDLPYSAFDIDKGVQHLQLMGVKYYMATTDAAVEAARGHEDLEEVAAETFVYPGTDGVPVEHTWAVFEVADSEIVTPLSYDPVVLSDADDHIDGWVYAAEHPEAIEGQPKPPKAPGPAVLWYNDPTRWDVLLATSGPDDWPRAPSTDLDPPRQATGPAEVSKIEMTSDTVSFSVDEVGVPVLVKVSYFPNWTVSGAEGPYRVSPNFMVVVPTEHDVVLSYGYRGTDLLGWLLTAVGVVLLGLLGAWDVRDRRRADERSGGEADGAAGDPDHPSGRPDGDGNQGPPDGDGIDGAPSHDEPASEPVGAPVAPG